LVEYLGNERKRFCVRDFGPFAESVYQCVESRSEEDFQQAILAERSRLLFQHLVARPLIVAPEILTERTRMRAHRVEDFAAMTAMWAEEAVVRFILGRPSAPSETWSRLLRYMGHWQALGFGYWAVEDRETGEYLGDTGFADYQREISPPLGNVPEAGWALVSSAHGKGLATEIVKAAHDWADRNFLGEHTVAIFDPTHEGSVRVAEKCGYVRSHDAIFLEKPTLVMQRTRHA
jgi:RimJ/RimL family protein N-acetyltransferase